MSGRGNFSVFHHQRIDLALPGDDAAGHIVGGRRFDRMDDPSVIEQHRIRVGAAEIDAAEKSATGG